MKDRRFIERVAPRMSGPVLNHDIAGADFRGHTVIEFQDHTPRQNNQRADPALRLGSGATAPNVRQLSTATGALGAPIQAGCCTSETGDVARPAAEAVNMWIGVE